MGVNADDVRRKVLQQLVKKGFAEAAVSDAYDASDLPAKYAGDYDQTFNEAKRRLLARVMEKLGDSPAAPAAVNAPTPQPEQSAQGKGKVKALRAKTARAVWNPDVVLNGGGKPPPESAGPSAPSVSTELLRWNKANAIRNKLFKLCKKHEMEVPLNAFERWLARSKLHEDKKRARLSKKAAKGTAEEATLPPDDPLLPGISWCDNGLVHDLVRGGLEREAAVSIAEDLAAKAAKAVAEIAAHAAAGEPEPPVCVSSTNVMFLFALGEEGAKPFLELNKQHYTKLLEMHKRVQQVERVDLARFHEYVYCLLARYAALQGHGYQAALTNHGFDVLLRRMGVKLECFASPLNCRYGEFCSAFPDTDAAFGSQGSFFQFAPTRGSYEANPPFVPEVMLHMVMHMEALLAATELPLSFTVLVPNWEDTNAVQQLGASRFRTGGFVVGAAAHTFCDGAQHQRAASERFRPSSFDTLVAVLQNSAGAEEWPVGSELETDLCAAMAAEEGTSGALSIQEMETRNRKDPRPAPGGVQAGGDDEGGAEEADEVATAGPKAAVAVRARDLAQGFYKKNLSAADAAPRPKKFKQKSRGAKRRRDRPPGADDGGSDGGEEKVAVEEPPKKKIGRTRMDKVVTTADDYQ